MLCRRQFIKNSAISSATLISSTIPNAIRAIENINTELYQQEFTTFMSLSHHLTGFDELDTELGSYFYDYIKTQTQPQLWHQFLEQFSSIEDTQSIDLLINDPAVRGLARSLTKLWYSGWSTATDLVPIAIKSKAYQQALAWKALGIHAKGQTTNQLWQHPTQTGRRENNDNL